MPKQTANKQEAFERLVKLTGRLERLCGEYMTVYIDLGDVANGDELREHLTGLEAANSGIVSWIRKARGLKHDAKIYTHTDVTNILQDKDATRENL